MARSGFGRADWLHAFLDEFPPLILEAKRQDLKVVSEIYILLSADRIVAEERRTFPGLERPTPDIVGLVEEFFGELLAVTKPDYFLCPSEAVRDDLVRNFGVSPGRSALVPYGVSTEWFSVNNVPVPGRVLFAGTADLRKGIHYLGMAAEKLKEKDRRYDFRVAGDVAKQIAIHPMFRHLNFLGRVPRANVAAELESADILVLPSLAEGSAGVTYEALAAGIPVVTTKAAGSVVRDGIEGRIIPERDSTSLVSAIEEIVDDRGKREGMAAAARKRALEYTWDRYGERLVSALRDFGALNS